MATAIKKCRVCGKSYEACHTMRNTTGVFRWREVACSPECGSIYLAKIEESRGLVNTNIKNTVEDISTDLIVDDDENEELEELYNELDEYFDCAE